MFFAQLMERVISITHTIAFTPVESVMVCGQPSSEFYDFNVEFIHSYNVSGYTGHNSTMMLHVSKCLAAQGFNSVYLDVEHGVSDDQRTGMGLDPFVGEKIFFKEPSTYTDVDEVMMSLTSPGSEVDFIFIDSVTQILPTKLREVAVESIQPGIRSRLTNDLLNKYKAICKEMGNHSILYQSDSY